MKLKTTTRGAKKYIPCNSSFTKAVRCFGILSGNVFVQKQNKKTLKCKRPMGIGEKQNEVVADGRRWWLVRGRVQVGGLRHSTRVIWIDRPTR